MALVQTLDSTSSDSTGQAPPPGGGHGGATPPRNPKNQPSSTSSLYGDVQKVHPRQARGQFRRIKDLTNIALLAIYFIGPWIPWPRGEGTPNQAILLDMTERRGYFFWIEIWPQEIYYLTGLLLLGAIGLFFATALLGRVWCGFTCIQTVFTDIFVAIERRIEGDRNARIKFDKQPWDADKTRKKAMKYGLWLLVSLATAWTWLAYFNPAWQMSWHLISFQAGWGLYGFLALFSGLTFLLAGFAREQVCIYMCPWPRFQAAMFDEHSLIVTYQKWRGEPRGKSDKQAEADGRDGREGLGDCIDCGMCVQVCPTGIDIRNGNQLACIGCGLCVDACNEVMEKVGLPRNLIMFDSEVNQVAKAKGQPPKPVPFVRPRTVVYAAMLAAVGLVMVYSLATRSRIEVNLLHERSPLFVELSDGQIRNGYTLKILNMVAEPRSYVVALDGIEGAGMSVVGLVDYPVPAAVLDVPADEVGTFRMYVTAPHESLDGRSTDLTLVVTEQDTGEVVKQHTMFAGP